MLRRAAVAAVLMVMVAAHADEKKEAAVKLTRADVQEVQKKDGPDEADAKKKWHGKVVDLFTLRWSYNNDVTAGPHAGQAMFNLDVGDPDTARHSGTRLVVYLKDDLDIGTLRNLRAFNRTPVRVRGRLVVDYKTPSRIWMEDASLVRPAGERETEQKLLDSLRQAVRVMEKTTDGKRYVLPAATQRALSWNDRKIRELARAWDGKPVEVVCAATNSYQHLKSGPQAGQTNVGLQVAEAKEPKWEDRALTSAYFKNERDVATLINRGRNAKPFTVQGTLRTDAKRSGSWIEDARLVRAPGELEKEDRDIEAGRNAILNPEKTTDGKALVLGVAALKGMKWNDRKNRDLTKAWAGKTVEVTVGAVQSSQAHKTGRFAGQTSFGFAVDEPGMVEWSERTGVPAYFKDARDIAEVKTLWKARNRKFKVRGTFVIEEKNTWSVWIADARLVND